MTTIKLIPQAMEFDVSLDSASMPSLFSQSIETTIIQEVDRQVNGRMPSDSSIAESVTEKIRLDRDFCRKIRDWVMESIDYDAITTDVRENIEYSEIAENILDSEFQVEAMVKAIIQNSRFKTQMNNALELFILNLDIPSRVDDKIAEMATNMENRIIEQVLNTLGNRLIQKLDQ
jgi:hypothetical protein